MHATCSPRNSAADLHRDHLHERLPAVFGTAHVRQDGAADARRGTGGLGGLIVLFPGDAGGGVWLRASAGALSRPEIGAAVSPCPPGAGTCGAAGQPARDIGGHCAGRGLSLAPHYSVPGRGPAVLCAFGKCAAAPGVVRSQRSRRQLGRVFPLCREQRWQPGGATGLSAADRAAPGAHHTEPDLGGRLRVARCLDRGMRLVDASGAAGERDGSAQIVRGLARLWCRGLEGPPDLGRSCVHSVRPAGRPHDLCDDRYCRCTAAVGGAACSLPGNLHRRISAKATDQSAVSPRAATDRRCHHHCDHGLGCGSGLGHQLPGRDRRLPRNQSSVSSAIV